MPADLSAPVRRVLQMRQYAIEVSDGGLRRECESQLDRWGIERSVYETDPVAAVESVKQTRPVKARTRSSR